MDNNKEKFKNKNKKVKNLSENFIQQIWQYQFFNKNKHLTTTASTNVKIINPGTLNINSGPDFIKGHILLGNSELYGDIEIHKKASEWYLHKHNNDKAYDNVILHVVLDNDKKVFYNNGEEIPTLILKNYISTQNIKNLSLLLKDRTNMCKFRSGEELLNYDKIVKQRIERKTKFILSLLEDNKGDWEETFLQLLFFNFGFKVNSKEMLQLAKSISHKIILKNKDKKENILALLLGQANLIERFYKNNVEITSNMQTIKKTYLLLKTKYKLKKPDINWHFSRLRPQNFPTQRILQLADILHKDIVTIEKILNNPLEKINKLLINIKPTLSSAIIENISINTVFQIQESYNQIHSKCKDINTDLLKKIKGEQNNIITKMAPLKPNNALESQGLIEVYNNFCKKKKCLECELSNCINKRNIVKRLK